MINPSPEDELSDLLAELATTTDMSPEAIDTAIEAYPMHREAILRFAIDWHAHDFAAGDDDVAALAKPDLAAYQTDVVADPFGGKSATQLRAAAAACDIPLSLLSKLESRAIGVETIPLLLIRSLASNLAIEVSKLLGFLSLEPTLPSAADYRSDRPPQTTAKVSFADAVRSTTMAEDQRARWLELSE